MRHVTMAAALALGALEFGTSGCGAGGSSSGGSTAAASEAERFSRMSVDDVAAGIQAPDRRLAVFDANDRETFEQHHVPSATWVDYDGVTREQLPADTSTPLVFYCYNESCSASHVAAESAVAMGFSTVSVMGAGIAGWVAAGQPVEAAAPAASEPL
jgi:rhodanese-related sulfurtransferase